MLNITEFITTAKQLSHLENRSETIEELMVEYMSDIESVQHDFSRAPGEVGDRYLRYPDLFILDSWLDSHFKTAPHDHGTWVVVGLFEGQEDNILYTRENESLKEKDRVSLTLGKVVLFDSKTIHAISNPLSTPTRALHIYGTDLFSTHRKMWNPLTMEESPFEPNKFSTYSQTIMQQANTLIRRM